MHIKLPASFPRLYRIMDQWSQRMKREGKPQCSGTFLSHCWTHVVIIWAHALSMASLESLCYKTTQQHEQIKAITATATTSFCSKWPFALFPVLFIMNKTATNILIYVFGRHKQSFLLHIYLGVELVDHWVNIHLALIENV